MQKRRPDGSGVVLLGGVNCDPLNNFTPESQAADAAQQLRALRILQRFSLPATLASDIAQLAYGETRP